MALKVAIQKSKDVSRWCEYKDDDGNILAEFKVRGDHYKAYRVALERAHNQIASNGYNVLASSPDHKLFHELLWQAAVHLVEDWKGVEFTIDGESKEVACNGENICTLFDMGDIGPAIWVFIKNQAELIQKEAIALEADILGKSKASTSI